MKKRSIRYLLLAGLSLLAALIVARAAARAAGTHGTGVWQPSATRDRIQADRVRPNEDATYTVSVFLPVVIGSFEPAWITGTYQGLYSICQNAPGITATLEGSGGFALFWDDHGGGASAGLGDPLGNTWDCRSVMVFAFSAPPPRGQVLSGTVEFSNAWTTVQNKNVPPQAVPVAFRQTHWTSAPPEADPRALWFDTRPISWTQSLPSFQGLCSPTTLSVPPGALVVQGSDIGIMVYSSSIDRPELWQPDAGRFVDYGHSLTWGGSCPGPRPVLRLLVQPEVSP